MSPDFSDSRLIVAESVDVRQPVKTRVGKHWHCSFLTGALIPISGDNRLERRSALAFYAPTGRALCPFSPRHGGRFGADGAQKGLWLPLKAVLL